MIGALFGDVVGSVFEHAPHKSIDIPLFDADSCCTDDTVLTIATAHAILTGTPFVDAYRKFANRWPDAGYGDTFREWMRRRNAGPYGSWGNGSAMRVSPVAWAFDSESDVLRESERSAAVTHDHPDGIAGAQAVALAVFLARTGASKDAIRERIARDFGYALHTTTDAIRPTYRFDVSCAGSLPQAIVAFLDAESVEHAVRLAVSLGGDADTQASIAGAIAEAYFRRIPAEHATATLARLDPALRDVAVEFHERFVAPRCVRSQVSG